MTGAVPARVSVNVLPPENFTRVRFSSSHKNVPTLTLTLDGKDRVERALEELDSGLIQVKEALPALDASDDDLLAAYSALEDLGDALWYALFGNDETAIHGLQEFWKSAMPFARDPRSLLLVECVADTPFPVEYLPLLGPLPAQSATSRADLLDRFRSFIGFSCLVQRKTLAPQSAGTLTLAADGDGSIPVRYLQYDTLPGACRELTWFTQCGQRVRLEGPYPMPNGPSASRSRFSTRGRCSPVGCGIVPIRSSTSPVTAIPRREPHSTTRSSSADLAAASAYGSAISARTWSDCRASRRCAISTCP